MSENLAELREHVEALEAAVFEDSDWRPGADTGEAKEEPATTEPEEADLPAPDPEIVVAVDALEWDVSASKTERRVEAVAICYELLREEGRATTADLRDRVYSAYDDGLTESTWWSNVVTVLLKRLDGVESPPSGGRTWRFQSESR